MTWFKPSEKKPVQGKKVLCMHHGDLYVAQRYKDYWLSIPFCDSQFAFRNPPDLWREIDFPNDLTGMNRVLIDGMILDMDTYQEKYPKEFEEFVAILSSKKW